MILWWHEQQHHPLCELDAVERHHTHVEEDAKQHSQGDLTQQVADYNGQACREESRGGNKVNLKCRTQVIKERAVM